MANGFTAIRLLLAAPFAYFMMQGSRRAGLVTLAIFWVAAFTDYFDGPLARRLGKATPWGGTFDHVSDFLFVAAGLFAGAARGVWPWVLPILVTAAFAQYTIDSYGSGRGRLRGSRLGRWNGILYFVPPCVDAFMRGMNWSWPRIPLRIFVWALVLSTLVSMGQRLAFREKLAAGSAQK